MLAGFEDAVWGVVSSDPRFLRYKTTGEVNRMRRHIMHLPILFSDVLNTKVTLTLLADLRYRFLQYYRYVLGEDAPWYIVEALEYAGYLARHIAEYLDQFEVYKREYITSELQLTRNVLLRIDEGITVRELLLEYPYLVIRPA